MIDSLKEIVTASPSFYVGWGGLLIGVIFGFTVYRTNFCTMGSISDILSFGNFHRFRAWMLAILVGIIGVVVLKLAGITDVADSMYLTPNLNWLANIAGGLLFGFGMVFSGGCISRNLVRAGAGDLRSMVVLMITGMFAFMTIGGLLGPMRVGLFGPSAIDLGESGAATQRVGDLLALFTGLSVETAGWISVAVITAGLAYYVFKDRSFLRSGKDVTAGLVIGLAVVTGWTLTGLAQDDFADVPVALASLTYVRPTGDTMDYLMRFTAYSAIPFGVVTLAGALLGGFLGGLSRGRLHLTTFADKSDSIRNMGGAALMGIGGVLAFGCTVGQGLTGVSTLAVGSFLALLSIIMGAVAGIKLIERMA